MRCYREPSYRTRRHRHPVTASHAPLVTGLTVRTVRTRRSPSYARQTRRQPSSDTFASFDAPAAPTPSSSFVAVVAPGTGAPSRRPTARNRSVPAAFVSPLPPTTTARTAPLPQPVNTARARLSSVRRRGHTVRHRPSSTGATPAFVDNTTNHRFAPTPVATPTPRPATATPPSPPPHATTVTVGCPLPFAAPYTTVLTFGFRALFVTDTVAPSHRLPSYRRTVVTVVDTVVFAASTVVDAVDTPVDAFRRRGRRGSLSFTRRIRPFRRSIVVTVAAFDRRAGFRTDAAYQSSFRRHAVTVSTIAHPPSSHARRRHRRPTHHRHRRHPCRTAVRPADTRYRPCAARHAFVRWRVAVRRQRRRAPVGRRRFAVAQVPAAPHAACQHLHAVLPCALHCTFVVAVPPRRAVAVGICAGRFGPCRTVGHRPAVGCRASSGTVGHRRRIAVLYASTATATPFRYLYPSHTTHQFNRSIPDRTISRLTAPPPSLASTYCTVHQLSTPRPLARRSSPC